MKKICLHTLLGIAWGCTIFTLMSLTLTLTMGETFLHMSPQTFITQIICSIISGIAFCVPAIVYDYEHLAQPIQVLIHMGCGLCIYFICAFYAGWIPVQAGLIPIILTLVLMVFIAFAIWFCFYLYYRHEANQINQKLKEQH